MKINNWIYKLAFLVLVTITGTATAQDFKSSQPFLLPLEINPALISANQDLRVSVGYRSQWQNIEGFNSFYGSILYPVLVKPNGKLDLALSYINDVEGAFTTNDIKLGLSYELELAKGNHLSLGISGGYLGKSLTTSDLVFDDQYVAGSFQTSNITNEALTGNNVNIGDVGFGLLYFYVPEDKKVAVYAGVSGYHFYLPKESYIENGDGKRNAKYTYITGMRFMPHDKIHVSPNLKLTTQGGAKDISGGLYFDYVMVSQKSTSVKKAKASVSIEEQKLNDAKEALKKAKQELKMAKMQSKIEEEAMGDSLVADEDGFEIDTEEKSSVASAEKEYTAKVSDSKLTGIQVTLGTWYGFYSKTPSILIGVKYDKFALAYSYDFAPAYLRPTFVANSTHEITASFFLPVSKRDVISPVSIW